jgi:hypothetical protein
MPESGTDRVIITAEAESLDKFTTAPIGNFMPKEINECSSLAKMIIINNK